MKKLGIIGGAGGLGSTMGFHIGGLGLFETIALVDIKENLVKSHVMDMSQSLEELSSTKIVAGGWADLEGCDMVIMTAAVPAVKVASRNEFLQVNLKIVKAAAEEIAKYCPTAIILTATAPIDVYNYIFHKIIGGDRRRFIGFSRNDSLRLRWAAGKILNVPIGRINGLVIGEHGETQVPLYSTVTVDGQPANLTASQIKDIDAAVKNWFSEFQALDSGRTSAWTSSTSIGFVVQAIAGGGPNNLMPGSAILEGEYGFSGLSIGMPLIYGPGGWEKITELDLGEADFSALKYSAGHIKNLIDQCER